MAGSDKSNNMAESSRSRLTPEDKGWFTTGFNEIVTIAIPRRAAPAINNIPHHR
jgi:hypothetical protein